MVFFFFSQILIEHSVNIENPDQTHLGLYCLPGMSSKKDARSGQIYHSRLRLECSNLKYHLYTKNIVQESRCSCGAIETTSHYLLSCDLYRNQRLRYLYLIPQPLSVPKLLFGIPEATTEENNFIFKQVQLYILATKRFAMPSS